MTNETSHVYAKASQALTIPGKWHRVIDEPRRRHADK